MAYSKKLRKNLKKGVSIIFITLVSVCIIFSTHLLNNTEQNSSYETSNNFIEGEKVKNSKTYQEAFNDHVLVYSSFETEGANGLPIDEVTNQEYVRAVSNSFTYNTTALSKNGSKSVYFPGNASQRLLLGGRNDLNFGTNDFSVEFWAYCETQTMPYSLFFGNENNVDLNFFCKDEACSYNVSLQAGGGSGYTRIIDTGKTYTENEWKNYKIVRKNGIFIVYEDNIEVGRNSSYQSVPVNLSNLVIGGNTSAGNTAFKGYIDDFTVYDIALQEVDICMNYRNEYIKIKKDNSDLLDLDVCINAEDSVILWNKGPISINNSDFVWYSSDNDIATVDSNGVVTGKSLGDATITAYNASTGIKAKCIVHVYNNKQGAITVPQVQQGEYFDVILKEDGTVWTTGINNAGQLGNGTTVNSNIPVQVKIDENTYLTNVKKIATFYAHTCALTTDGEVYAWGFNEDGFLGQGDAANRVYATKVKGVRGEGYLQNIIDIAMTHDEAYYLDNDGNLYGAGSGWGFLGGAASAYPTKIGGPENIISITTGDGDIAAIFGNAKTCIWGYNGYGSNGNGTTKSKEVVMFCLGNDIDDIKLGGYSGYYLKEDNTVWSSGLNNYGQLGLGDTSNRTVYNKIKFEDETDVKAKKIVAGSRNLMFIGEDGKLYATGYNAEGQLSNGTTSNAVYPTLMKNEDGTDVEDALFIEMGVCAYNVNSHNSAIIREDGTVWKAGNNTYGQIGNCSFVNSSFFVKSGLQETELNYRNEYIKVGSTIDVNVLRASEFNVFIKDSNITQSDWTWKSSNDDIATVDNDGKVTGISIGEATITGNNNGLKAKIIVHVYRNKDGAITVPQVCQTEVATYVLKEDGTVWSTGYNGYGQLGQGETSNKNKPGQVKIDEETYLTNVIKIGTTHNSVVALTKDGNLYAWGMNQYGMLGVGDTSNRYYATKVKGVAGEGYLENIIDVAIGHQNILAIDNNGDLYGVGYGAGNIGTLFGAGTTYTPIKLTKLNNLININVGYGEVAAITTAGNTCVWGENSYGELGTGNTSHLSNPCYIRNDIDSVKPAGYSMYYLREDGTIWGTGLNNYGQLGVGDASNRTAFVQMKYEDGSNVNAKQIEAGARNFIFKGTDNKLYITGYNGYGQFSNGSTVNSSYPKLMKYSDETEVTDAIYFESSDCWYENNNRNSAIIKADGTVYVSGDNTYGQIGNALNSSSLYLVQFGGNNVELNYRNEYIKIGESVDIDVISAGQFNVFIQDAITQSDWTWKSSDDDIAQVDSAGKVTGKSVGEVTITGYCINGLKAKVIVHVYRNKQGAITVPQVEEGEYYTVVLKEDGTVWTSGINNAGQLGNGTTTNSSIPTQVMIDENTYLTNIRKIAVNYAHNYALTVDGEVYAWGFNEDGFLGQGDTTSRLYATKIKDVDGVGYLKDIIDISLTHDDGYFLDKNGELYGVGNGYGFLGAATTYIPIKINGLNNIASITTGDGDVAAILSNGSAFIWGYNGYGSNGNGRTSSKESTVNYLPDNVNVIELGGYSGYLLKEDNTVWASGLNNYGQLGQGDTQNRTVYTQVKFEDGTEVKAKKINAGSRNLIFIGEDNKVYVTGYNGNAQLSNGTVNNATYPILMKNNDGSDVEDALFIEMGVCYYNQNNHNSAIIREDGTVWMAGDNTYGQIGNGDTSSTLEKYLTKMGVLEVELNYRNEYIKNGSTIDINVVKANQFNVFIQDDVDQSEWSWKSSNEDVATVNNNGMVTGKSIGHTTITAYNSITGLSAKAIIHVYNNKQGAITVPQVANMNQTTVVLKENGTVWASGLNNVGQCRKWYYHKYKCSRTSTNR